MSLYNSMNTGVSALRSFGRGIAVIGDNIANMSTTGFKKGRADYSDNFNQLLHSPQASENNTPHRSASHVGGGVNVSQVSTDFNTGDATYTGLESDLAINGNGFFRVVDTGGNEYLTRAGNFRVDDNGYLVSPQGYRLQGADGALRIPDSVEGLAVTGWSFTAETGVLNLVRADGSTTVAGQVSLALFRAPDALEKKGSNLFQSTGTAGFAGNISPGAGQPATVQSRFLELSNVDITEEFANMITTQRAFQAGAKIITTADQLMQEAIQLKR